jgi:hypothetical protein
MEMIKTSTIAEQKTVNGRSFPLVLEPNDTTNTDTDSFMIWLKDNKQSLREKLVNHGAILFRNCPIDSPESFEKMLEQSDFINMPYIGGAAPRKQVTEKRIITANESPASEKIPFHHEMAQVPNPPNYIFFYCDLAAQKGGATAILHSNEIYKKFVSISPTHAKEIEEKGVKYTRIMPDKDDHLSPIGRSWRSTFLTESKEAAEEKMSEMGMDWQWLDNGALKTITATLPAIRSDQETGLKTFYNSIVAAYMGWQDSRNERKKAVTLADGTEMNEDLMMKTSTAMDESAVAFPWKKGDVLWINNNLVLHSRQPYEGDRRILASIAIADQ